MWAWACAGLPGRAPLPAAAVVHGDGVVRGAGRFVLAYSSSSGLTVGAGGRVEREVTRHSVEELASLSGEVECNVGAAVEALQQLGLRRPVPHLLKAIAIGLTHRSHLYEHYDEYSGLTFGILDALQGLGANFVRKQATAEMYQLGAYHSVGDLSSSVAQVHAFFPTWAAGQNWLTRSCAISRGLDARDLPPKVITAVGQQLVGVLCLVGEDGTAAAMVREVIAVAQNEDVADPKTLLQERLRTPPSYSYERTGPDHETVFHASVSDGRGRRGVGQGRGKKAAARAAALNFLKSHLPETLGRPQGPKSWAATVSELPGQIGHRQVVTSLQSVFSLTPAARPLLSQALIHSSWTYENKELVAACHQQDQQVLGFIGSQVLNFEHSLACAWRVLGERQPEFTALTLPNEVCVSAFERAQLVRGLMLGVGQRGLGVPSEVAGNTFQAVVGAVFVHHKFPTSLGPLWPQAWEDLRQLVFPGTPPSMDQTTLMQRATSAMRLEFEVSVDVEGAGSYAPRYRASFILQSPALGDKADAAMVTGPWASDKTRAKRLAAQAILNALDRLALLRPDVALAESDKNDRELALFILAHQAAVLTQQKVTVRRWVEHSLFGMHLVDAELLAWMEAADRLLMLPEGARSQVLNGAFPATLGVALRPHNDFTGEPSDELDSLLTNIERIEEPGELTVELLNQMVELCAIYRGLSDNAAIDLADLGDEWRLLHRGRLISGELPPMRLFGVERAVLDAAVRAVVSSTGRATVHAPINSPSCLEIRSEIALDAGQISRTCALWSRTSKTIKLTPAAGGIDATVLRPSLSGTPGPLAEVALIALQAQQQPHQDMLANLLHDMKNQLVAVRQAAAATATGRTARLERQLVASRHLDQAHSLAVRLRSTTSLLASAGTGSVELGSFLRDYVTSLLPRLPRKIRLNVPDAHSEVIVALEPRAVTAILDNLLGNAIAALRDGGAISLDWTADTEMAIVEIGDDGPGLPADIRASFEQGARIRTTTPGGNGLGLLGARALLERAGGQLTAPATSVGTAWLISLPLLDASEEDV